MGKGIIAVTGASGFVGRHVIAALVEAGYTVRALVRDLVKAREALPAADARITLVVGDVLDPGVAAQLVTGCAACINLIGILRESGRATFKRTHVESTRALVEACEKGRVPRFLQMSALGASELGRAAYQTTKFEGERLVRESTLAWTIFRPSLIHGPESEFLDMVAGFASGLEPPYVFLPYFRRWKTDKRVPMGGEEQIDPVVEPVHVDDVARAFVKSLENTRTIGEIYNLAGSERLAWPQVLELIRDHAGGNPHLRAWGVPAPLAAAVASGAAMVGLGKYLPFDRGMVVMASEDSVSEMDKARKHLGMEFRAFTPSFMEYAEGLAEH
jgi:NADH dehydrogenase